MAYSGRLLDVAGTALPEVVVVDNQQLERAIADPYGYRTNPIPTYTAAVPNAEKWARWGQVKQL